MPKGINIRKKLVSIIWGVWKTEPGGIQPLWTKILKCKEDGTDSPPERIIFYTVYLPSYPTIISAYNITLYLLISRTLKKKCRSCYTQNLWRPFSNIWSLLLPRDSRNPPQVPVCAWKLWNDEINWKIVCTPWVLKEKSKEVFYGDHSPYSNKDQ